MMLLCLCPAHLASCQEGGSQAVLDFLSPGSQVAGSRHGHRAALSIHALNGLTGLPGMGLVVRCFQNGDSDAQWTELMKSSTDSNGLIGHNSPQSLQLKAGIYKLRFETGAYWQKQGYTSFYPYIEVVFTVTKAENKVHVPLLLSPYSYTTYKGN